MDRGRKYNMRIYTLWDIQTIPDVWNKIENLAKKENAQIWDHPDGSLAVATYSEMEEFCQAKNECDEWSELN